MAGLPVDYGATDIELAQTIFGTGVTVHTAVFTGDARSSGIYSDAHTVSPGVAPTDTGVILSTGFVRDFANESGVYNQETNHSRNTSGPNHVAEFDALAGTGTYDAAYLDVNFTPAGDTLSMRFVFASEEFPEYTNSQYQDFMAVWINGEYVPLSIGDAAVGSLFDQANESLIINNTRSGYNTEMDGFTVALTLTIPVNAGVANNIRIGIADVADANYDSNLLIAAESMTSPGADADNAAPVALTDHVLNEGFTQGREVPPDGASGYINWFEDPDGDSLLFAADGLPEGLRIDALTGSLYGTITAAPGTYRATIFAVDPDDAHTSVDVDILVNEPPIDPDNIGFDIRNLIALSLGFSTVTAAREHIADLYEQNIKYILSFDATAGASINGFGFTLNAARGLDVADLFEVTPEGQGGTAGNETGQVSIWETIGVEISKMWGNQGIVGANSNMIVNLTPITFSPILADERDMVDVKLGLQASLSIAGLAAISASGDLDLTSLEAGGTIVANGNIGPIQARYNLLDGSGGIGLNASIQVAAPPQKLLSISGGVTLGTSVTSPLTEIDQTAFHGQPASDVLAMLFDPDLAWSRSSPVDGITGTTGSEEIFGTASNDIIWGLGGDDTLRGLGGNDFLYTGGGDGETRDFARLFGGGGNDILVYSGHFNWLATGGSGNDTYIVDLGWAVSNLDPSGFDPDTGAPNEVISISDHDPFSITDMGGGTDTIILMDDRPVDGGDLVVTLTDGGDVYLDLTHSSGLLLPGSVTTRINVSVRHGDKTAIETLQLATGEASGGHTVYATLSLDALLGFGADMAGSGFRSIESRFTEAGNLSQLTIIESDGRERLVVFEYDEGALARMVDRLSNNDVIMVLYDENGLPSAREILDRSDTRNWDRKVELLDDTGTITNRLLEWDAGGTRQLGFAHPGGKMSVRIETKVNGDATTTFFNADGGRTSVLANDVSDRQNWALRLDSYDGSGNHVERILEWDQGGSRILKYRSDSSLFSRTDVAIDGDQTTFEFDQNGVRIGKVVQDVSKSQPWNVRFDNFQPDGTLSTRIIEWDDGSSRMLDYYPDGSTSRRIEIAQNGDLTSTEFTVSGRKESQMSEDVSNSRPWYQKLENFGDTGLLVDRFIFYDDGSTLSTGYNPDGSFSNKIKTEANGDETRTFYSETGVIEVRIMEDVSDSRDWSQRTETFDENGVLIDRSYDWDIA